MGGGYGNLSELGGFIIWAFNGFRGKYSDYRRNKYSFFIGLVFIIVSIYIFSIIW
jgi:hypothetical protein